MVQVISSSGAASGVSPGHISSISLEVGLLTRADPQMAAGAAPVCFGVPAMDGTCCCNGTAGDLHGVFVVAVRAAGTGAAGAAGGLAANYAGKASGVAGATTGVVDVSCLTASG